MPLYRQEKQLERLDLTLSRQTMANWMIKAATNWLEPVYESLKAFLLTRPTMHVDETTIQVLKEKDRSATSKSYMWLYRSGREDPSCVLFDYQTTRATKHPKRFLDGYKGILHVDGYKGYDGLPNVQLSGCWDMLDESLMKRPKLETLVNQMALRYLNKASHILINYIKSNVH